MTSFVELQVLASSKRFLYLFFIFSPKRPIQHVASTQDVYRSPRSVYTICIPKHPASLLRTTKALRIQASCFSMLLQFRMSDWYLRACLRLADRAVN